MRILPRLNSRVLEGFALDLPEALVGAIPVGFRPALEVVAVVDGLGRPAHRGGGRLVAVQVFELVVVDFHEKVTSTW